MKKSILKTISVFVILFTNVNIANAQTIALQWAKSMGGTSNGSGASIAVDASGNVYTTGAFQGTVDFDPGVAVVNLTSVGIDDIFISKLDASGNLVWVKSIGSAQYDFGNSIALDASGNIYTTGYFYGTVDFDPGAGTFNLISAGNNDIFISKLDASGNFVWAKSIGGIQNDEGTSIVVSPSGNVYTTGTFFGTVDFDTGAGTFNLNSASGSRDIFISKMDASGNFVWAKNMGGDQNEFVHSIALDPSGNIYTTGSFNGTADFDPGAGTFNLTSSPNITDFDIFISKLDAAGNFVWAKSMGGGGDDIGYSIVPDGTGNVYTTGFFDKAGDFDPGAGISLLTSNGSLDIFVSKLDAAGNFVWAKNMGGASADRGRSIALDASGNVYTTGYFSGIVDFDPGAGTFNLTDAGVGDIFLSKLDASGNFVLAKNMGGTLTDVGNAITLDALGNIYTTGSFQGTSDFDPDAGAFNLTSAGGSDIFVHKMGPDPAGFNELWNQSSQLSIFPNPTTGTVMLSLSETPVLRKVEIFNTLGSLIYSSELSAVALAKVEIDLSQQPAGIYFIRIGTVTKKIIKE